MTNEEKKIIIAGVFDVVGKVILLVGLTMIHPGLGLAYGGYVISETAHKQYDYYLTAKRQAKAEASLLKLVDTLNTKGATVVVDKGETLH